MTRQSKQTHKRGPRSPQFTYTPDSDQFDLVEQLAAEIGIEKNTIARAFLKDRLDLYMVGWDYADLRTKALLLFLMRLSDDELEEVKGFLADRWPDAWACMPRGRQADFLSQRDDLRKPHRGNGTDG